MRLPYQSIHGSEQESNGLGKQLKIRRLTQFVVSAIPRQKELPPVFVISLYSNSFGLLRGRVV